MAREGRVRVAGVLLVGVAATFALGTALARAPSAGGEGCAVVDYAVDDDFSVSGPARELREAVDELAGITGIRFRPLGRSVAGAEERDPELRWVWESRTRSATFRADPTVAAYTISQTGSQGRVVVVHLDGRRRMGRGAGPGTWAALIRHELGHALGLGHSDDAADLMHPDVDRGPGRWSDHELSSLREIGAARGCPPGHDR